MTYRSITAEDPATDQAHAGVLFNLSTSGVGFLASEALKKDTRLILEFQLGNIRWCLESEVVRCRPVFSYYEVGARLLRKVEPEANAKDTQQPQ